MKFDKLDKKITKTLKQIGLPFLRYSLSFIFIWFGLGKLIGNSLANELVKNTIYWIPSNIFLPILGVWEVLIGLCFLHKRLLRIGIFLLMPQIIGTFLPFLVLPNTTLTTTFPYLSLEGQYILKNLIILGAALVIGSHVRDKI